MLVIETRYYTTSTGAGRISAQDNTGQRVSIPYPHELSGEAVHLEAVKALCEKIGQRLDSIEQIETNKPGYMFIVNKGG